MEINLKDCISENTLDTLYDKHDGAFICIVNNNQYIIGELNWEQGHAPNYYIEANNHKYYHNDIKQIGILPNLE